MRTLTVVMCLLSESTSQAQEFRRGCDKITPEEVSLINKVAESFNVPAGLLYGIWRKESSCLADGYRSGPSDWYLAAGLMTSESKCVYNYGWSRCVKHWQALVAMCSQVRKSGSLSGQKVCDPFEVYTSYALAMGPTQHMPGEIFEKKVFDDGTYTFVYTLAAIDFDGDGVVDLHSLADSMAITAYQLSVYKRDKKFDTWPNAAIRYFGWANGSRRYYYGSHGKKNGVRHYWREWCHDHGCR